MSSLKCRKNTENINPRVSKTSNDKAIILSKYSKCGSEKSRYIKKQEVREIMSNFKIIK